MTALLDFVCIILVCQPAVATDTQRPQEELLRAVPHKVAAEQVMHVEQLRHDHAARDALDGAAPEDGAEVAADGAPKLENLYTCSIWKAPFP